MKIVVTPPPPSRKLKGKWIPFGEVDISSVFEYTWVMETADNTTCFHCDEQIEMMYGSEFFTISRHVNRIKLGKEVIRFHPDCLRQIAGKRFISTLSQAKISCKECKSLFDPVTEKQNVCSTCKQTALKDKERFLKVGKCDGCQTPLGNPYYSFAKRDFCKQCAEKKFSI